METDSYGITHDRITERNIRIVLSMSKINAVQHQGYAGRNHESRSTPNNNISVI